MSYIQQLLANRILITGLVGWAVAQVVKTVLYAIVNRTLNFERLVGDGGMPSAHSATVSSVALSTGFEMGFNSAVFAVALILAIIVMHDAMGVRRESGRHASAINELWDALTFTNADYENLSPDEQLKEFIGHSPTQVVAGCVLGIVIACISYLL